MADIFFPLLIDLSCNACLTSYVKTKFIIVISTQCNRLGGRGERNLGRRGRSEKEIWRNPGSFLAPHCTGGSGAPPKRPQKSVHWLLVERLHLSSSSTIAAKTVVAVACPGEGNDPIFTEVVESKSSVNLSAPTAAPIHYAKHYPTIPSPHPIPSIQRSQVSNNPSTSRTSAHLNRPWKNIAVPQSL